MGIIKNDPCKKVKYSTSKDADMAAAKLRIYSKRDIVPDRSYFCNVCSSYHLTSSKTVIQDNNDYLSEKYNKIKSDYDKLMISYNLLNKNTRDELLKIKKDERVLIFSRTIDSLRKEVRRIREDNRDLITKNIQLQNRINELLSQKHSNC